MNISTDNIVDGTKEGAEKGKVLKITAASDTVVKHDVFTENLVAGKKYTLRFRMKNNSLSGEDIGSVYLINQNGSVKDANTTLYATGSIWKEFVIDFEAKSDNLSPQLCIDLSNGKGTEFCFSDFSFKEYMPILPNGDFSEEDSSTSTGLKAWKIYWIEGTDGGTHEVLEDAEHGKVVKISKPRADANATDLRNEVLNEKLSVGQKYNISFDVKTTGTTDTDAQITLLLRTSDGKAISAVNQGATNGKWKTVSYEFVPEDGWQDTQVWIRTNPRTNSSLEVSDYYIANVSVTRDNEVYKGDTKIMNNTYSMANGDYPDFWGLIREEDDVVKGHGPGTTDAKIKSFYSYLGQGARNDTVVSNSG